MSVGLNYIKMPRNVSEYTLMKGVTDYSNLKQFDLYETGYSFLTVVSVPRFMQLLAAQDAKVKNLQDGFVHILEGEFRGLDGIPDITADAGTVTNGVNELQVINNVSMDTSIQVSMSFFERSGSLLTNYLSYYLTGIKDPYSKAKTYHGLMVALLLILVLIMRSLRSCTMSLIILCALLRRHICCAMLSLLLLPLARCITLHMVIFSSRKLA